MHELDILSHVDYKSFELSGIKRGNGADQTRKIHLLFQQLQYFLLLTLRLNRSTMTKNNRFPINVVIETRSEEFLMDNNEPVCVNISVT